MDNSSADMKLAAAGHTVRQLLYMQHLSSSLCTVTPMNNWLFADDVHMSVVND